MGGSYEGGKEYCRGGGTGIRKYESYKEIDENKKEGWKEGGIVPGVAGKRRKDGRVSVR